jgi:transcription initiation factor IIE alpha subunit|tara:strand:- start:746 stop:1045 length:300 start_codon:yes stop_codon:yes gene_type:complete
MKKLPIKLIFLLNAYPEGLTYNEISQKTRYHKHTISKQISYLDAKGLIDIEQKRSKNNKGRRWINFIKLKKELVDDNVTKFLSRISKQLNCSLNDLFGS